MSRQLKETRYVRFRQTAVLHGHDFMALHKILWCILHKGRFIHISCTSVTEQKVIF